MLHVLIATIPSTGTGTDEKVRELSESIEIAT
jgi:hypothetical protein